MRPSLERILTWHWPKFFSADKRKPTSIETAGNAAEKEFVAFISEHLDKKYYLRTNIDVAAAKIDPIFHWLEYGIHERRAISNELEVRIEDSINLRRGEEWRHFRWRGKDIVIRAKPAISETVLSQINRQGKHDPAVLAAGALAIPALRRVELRDGFEVDVIFDAARTKPNVVFIVPHFVIGGADKYCADLEGALVSLGYGSALIVVTSQTSQAAAGWDQLAIFAPLRDANVLFWTDVCRAHFANPLVLAQFVHALRPERLIVINSRLGLEMVASHGRALSRSIRLYCAYFGLGVDGMSAAYGVRFPRMTAPFAVTLTDNETTARIFQGRYGDLPGPGIAVLPPRLTPAEGDTFNDRLRARARRASLRPRSSRWLWVSRIEFFKGTAVLSVLAGLRPQDKFELYGPLQESLEQLGLDRDNISHRGIIKDLSTRDFSSYDGFIFTSLFEGMPNVVLEMTQHAIPLVVTRVGGLPDTLKENAAVFIESNADAAEMAGAFDRACDRILDMTPDEAVEMVTAARDQALARHSPENFCRRAVQLFGSP